MNYVEVFHFPRSIEIQFLRGCRCCCCYLPLKQSPPREKFSVLPSTFVYPSFRPLSNIYGQVVNITNGNACARDPSRRPASPKIAETWSGNKNPKQNNKPDYTFSIRIGLRLPLFFLPQAWTLEISYKGWGYFERMKAVMLLSSIFFRREMLFWVSEIVKQFFGEGGD